MPFIHLFRPYRYLLPGGILFFRLLTASAQDPVAFQPDNAELRTQPHPKRPDSLFLDLKGKYARSLERKDNGTAAGYLQQMGQVCYHLSRYPQALDLMLQAGKLYRNAGKPALLAANLNEVGILFYYTRQPERARQQYDEALAIFRTLNDRAGIAVTSGKIGHLYEKQQQYDKAFFYQRQALHYYRQLADQPGIAKIYENLGSIFEDLARYDSAHYYFENALQLYEQTSDETSRITAR